MLVNPKANHILPPNQKKIDTEFVPAQESQQWCGVKSICLDKDMKIPLSKKSKPAPPSTDNDVDDPIGVQWDAENYSCAYNSLFVMLYNIWIQDPKLWSRCFKKILAMNVL